MPNPFMNIGSLQGGQGMAPMTQNPQPQRGPMGQPQQMMGGGPPQTMPPQQGGAPTPGGVQNMLNPQRGQIRTQFGGSAGLQSQMRQYQTQMGELMSTMQAAQAQGAPPSVIQQLQSAIQNIQMQMAWAQADMNQARQDEQRAAERSVLEQQLGRAQSAARGAGNVGGSPNDPGRMYSLEDAILANSLGLGGGIRRFE